MQISKPRTQTILFAGASLCLVISAIAFAIAITVTTRTSNRIARDEHVHCLAFARLDNARRTLDLALIASDRHILRELSGLKPTSEAERRLADVINSHFTLALKARLDNVPPYTNPANC